MRIFTPFILILVFALTYSPTAHASTWWSQLKRVIPISAKQTSLAETQIGKGIREALSLGIDRAVTAASQTGGYLDNDTIRIKFPENLSMIETGLRKIGMGNQIDGFETSVNRAAEKAAPAAKNILLDSLMDMSIEDAEKLLKGGDTAATDYFKTKSWDKLYTAFQPYMNKTMGQYQVSQTYNQIIGTYQKIPFAQKPNLVSADKYATDKALEGLFHLVAEQERKIRTDPAARVTELLRSVFK